MKLSDARANAVVTAQATEHKIAAGRLRASGVGQLAPVASDGTEEGRAKKRRVELVKR
jgi:outer membrane protein OmpA-like peptidoglycan-associated protein